MSGADTWSGARLAASLLGAGLLAACDVPGVEPVPVRVPIEETSQLAALTDAALATQAEILEITESDNLRAFARYATASDGFVSNFIGPNHFNHWSLLRRTGVDPMRQIEALFAEPYGVRAIGDEVWYIWPDFAATSQGTLDPGRLNVRDRARLESLVGERGLAEIARGGAYPGIRTAISANGRWVYYLHELGESEDLKNE